MTLSKVSFRDREATIAAVVERVYSDGDVETSSDKYPTLLPTELRLLLKFWIRVAVIARLPISDWPPRPL